MGSGDHAQVLVFIWQPLYQLARSKASFLEHLFSVPDVEMYKDGNGAWWQNAGLAGAAPGV